MGRTEEKGREVCRAENKMSPLWPGVKRFELCRSADAVDAPERATPPPP